MKNNYTYNATNLAATTAFVNFFLSLGYQMSDSYTGDSEKYAKVLIDSWHFVDIQVEVKKLRGSSLDRGYEKLSLDGVFEKFSLPTEITVKLNSTYSAIVSKDGSFKVGCQTFSQQNLDDIQVAIKTLTNNKK